MKTAMLTQKQSGLMLVAAALGAMLAVTPAMAFPGGHGGGNCDGSGGGRIERMAERLNLSDAQRQQIKQIHRDARTEGMALHDAMQDNRDAMKQLNPDQKGYRKQVAKLAAEKGDLVRLMTIHRAEVKAKTYAVLTPEQRREAAQLKSNRFDRGDRGYGFKGDDRRGPGRPDGGFGPGRF